MNSKNSYEQYISNLDKNELEYLQKKIDKNLFPERYQTVTDRLKFVDATSEKETKHKRELKTAGILLGIFFVFIWLFIFPIPGWIFVILIGGLLKIIGITIDLVGPPDAVSIGAILTAVLNVFCLAIVALVLISKQQRYLASTIIVGGCAISYFVYIAVKNIMWF